jgi:hypothetical protein
MCSRRRRAGRDVEEVALGLAGVALGPGDRVHAVEESVAPAVEGLAVHVLVVLGGVQAADEAFVDNRGIVLGAEAQLGLDRAAQKRPIPLVQPCPFVVDAHVGAGEGLHQGDRHAHVFQAQGGHRLEAEDVAHDRRHDVDDAVLLEQVHRVGDVGDVVFDAVDFGFVVVQVGELVRPDFGPGAGRRLGGHGGGSLDHVHARRGLDAKGAEQIGVDGDIVGHIVVDRIRPHARLKAGASALADFFDQMRVSNGSTHGVHLFPNE